MSMLVPRAKSPSSDGLDSDGEGIVLCDSPIKFAITGTPTPSGVLGTICLMT